MKTIKGLTKRQTINALKRYLILDSTNYVCCFLAYTIPPTYICNVEEFVEYWVKKLYGSGIENNLLTGFFGCRIYTDSQLTRKAFVTLLIHELEK